MDVATLKIVLIASLMVATVAFSAWLPLMRGIVTRQVASGLMTSDHARESLKRLCNGPIVLALGVAYALLFHRIPVSDPIRWLGFAIAIGAIANSLLERNRAQQLA